MLRLPTFHVLIIHTWLVAAVLDSTDIGHFCLHRKVYWTVLTETLMFVFF